MGWFDGDPVNLSPLTRKELGAEIIALSGSAEKVFTPASKTLASGRYQAALELATMVLANMPKHEGARKVRIAALQSLSNSTINAPTMNYCRVCAAMEKAKGEGIGEEGEK